MSRSRRSFTDKLISFAVNLVFSAIALAVALLPFWTGCLIRHFLAPEAFWQNIIIAGLSIWFLGCFQILFFILWVAFVLKLCLKD
jgi:hypothetical protein